MNSLNPIQFVYLITLTCISVGFASSLSAAELSALEVMQMVESRDDGESFVADYTMVLIDHRDRQRTRSLRIYSKDYGADTRSLSRFESPADIRGTAYLNNDWDDPQKDDDSWL